MKCQRCGAEAYFVTPKLSLCEPCFREKFEAMFPELERRGLIERHGGNWRITEKGKAEEIGWDESWNEAEPDQKEDGSDKGEGRKDWLLVHVLENGETAVATKKGCVELMSYDEVKDLVGKMKPGTMCYAPSGMIYGSVDAFKEEIWHSDRPPIRVIAWQGIPRSDYDPKKHDTFHLKLGPQYPEFFAEVKRAMETMGLAGDLKNPGFALDVITNLDRLMKGQLIVDHPQYRQHMQNLLAQAHPILWAPVMTKMATDAVFQLNESLSVERDLLSLNPTIWLYTEPQWIAGKVETLEFPLTLDGHIPFRDENALDGGAFAVGRLFYFDEDKIDHWLFSLVMHEGEWLMEAGLILFPIGTTPSDDARQNVLKWLRFASSPYLVVKRYQPRRPSVRRAAGRYPVATEGIGVILLRRALQEYEKRRPGKGEPVNWSCQWWVSGFWRHQWYRSTQTHKPIWIAPYIKGPPDKPLKECIRLMVR